MQHPAAYPGSISTVHVSVAERNRDGPGGSVLHVARQPAVSSFTVDFPVGPTAQRAITGRLAHQPNPLLAKVKQSTISYADAFSGRTCS